MKIVTLTIDSIVPYMLSDFCHYQLITKKWTQSNNQWKITDTSILREWSEEKREWIPQYLCQQIERGARLLQHLKQMN